MTVPPDTLEIIRATIMAEAASEWALTRRVPSTHTWKALDYMASLESDERQALLKAIERNALFFFEPAPDASAHAADWPAFRRYRDAMVQMADWKYANARMLRLILGDVRGKKPSPQLAQTPPEVLERAAAIKPISAAQIRKVVKAAVGRRYGAKAETLGGGDWRYPGSWKGLPFELSIDYGGMSHQLRYAVAFEDPSTGLRARRLAYEWLVGVGHGDWDFLTADNIEASVELLCDLVERLLGLPSLIGA